MCSILGAVLLVPVATATKLTITIPTSPQGTSTVANIPTTFPLVVGFAVKSNSSLSSFLWQFGDGTTSTEASPTHTYDTPCVYDVHVQVTASNGSTASGTLVLGLFGGNVHPGGVLEVCTTQGTAGLILVELAGGYFTKGGSVNVLMNGTSIATVTADDGGDWTLNVTEFLTPAPNGTQYAFTTSPPSLESAFTTLEGIRATPASGAPGTSVVVEGRSYPPYSSVIVYLGGVSLGTTLTDAYGSFLTTFQVPFVPPLTSASTYPYSTIPAIRGSQASFFSAGITTTTTESTTLTETQTQTIVQPTTITQATTQTTTVTTTTTISSTSTDLVYAALTAMVVVVVAVAVLAAWALRGRRP